jgi:hypothetical protein
MNEAALQQEVTMAETMTNVRRTKMGATEPYYAVITTENNGTYPTYSEPKAFSEFVSLTESIQYAEAAYHSNNRESESSKIFKRCDLTFGNKGLTYDVMKDVFGAKLENGKLSLGAANTPPRIGFGFYRLMEDNGVRYYEGVYYPICRGFLGNESDATMGDNVTYSGDETALTAYTMGDADKTWKEMEIFTEEAEAKAWVLQRLGKSGT